ncbi:MAG: DUF4239 domain-containing protein [Candidatus Eremiobacteraeota bacterium]|nr:DUF4239 domain-containing protein [Candidatus Eremiobacteraeota bacterium]
MLGKHREERRVLYAIPPLLLLILAVAVAVTFAICGQLYVHRHFKAQDFVQHNEVAGFIISVVGTLYGVLLGFLTVVVWQHFSDSRDQVARESAAAADVWHTAVGLPYVVRSRVRDDMEKYAKIMISAEWPAMRNGGVSTDADIVVMDAMAETGTLDPANLREASAQLATQQQLTVLHDERQRRIADNDAAVTWFEWVVLFIGGVSVLCFCWLFGLRNPTVHLLMTAAVAVVMTSTLVLLYELQYPFRSPIGIGTATWQGLLAHIELMQHGSQMYMRM